MGFAVYRKGLLNGSSYGPVVFIIIIPGYPRRSEIGEIYFSFIDDCIGQQGY